LFSRAAKNLGMANKKHCILSSRAEKIFGIYQQKELELTVFCFAAQRKILELRTKAPHFVQPRSEKSTAFCSAAQEKISMFSDDDKTVPDVV
jgi:hypothetical protein